MNIAFYYSQHSVPRFEPGTIFGTADKLPVYKNLLDNLRNQGVSVYFACSKNYCGEQYFTNTYLYDGTNFVLQTKKVKIDLLFDRSSARHIPPEEFLHKIYNSLAFKKLCNKKDTLFLLGEYMSKSFSAQNPKELRALLEICDPKKKIVIKPGDGIRGQGIQIDTPNNILRNLPKLQYPYILQEFVDTSKGIEGISSSLHDLRIIAVNGKIIMAVLRTPPAGSLMANVALGGSIEEVPLAKIPTSIFKNIQKVFEKIESVHPGSFYSMDFGVENGQPYLFELNDRIGFPRVSMPSADLMIEELVQKLTNTVTSS